MIEVLKGIDLTIFPGEMMAVEGASGAGKSTLLHILGTSGPGDGGEGSVSGNRSSRADRSRTGRDPQPAYRFCLPVHHLLPEFNAVENTMMPALIRGMSREEAGRKAERILEELGLGDRLLHKPGELSGGEQQRVAVARALMLDPRIILADEPTGNLDTKTGEEVHNRLVQINRSLGITIVVVTHNPALASRMTRRVLLVDGKLYENQ